MNFDKLLDFLYHRILGIALLFGSLIVTMMVLSGCMSNDTWACFWQCIGCEDCSQTCQECSAEEDAKCYEACGGSGCVLNDCFNGPGCDAQCGSCYTTCGGVNYSCYQTVCFGDGCGEGCYEGPDGYQRHTCLNCYTYCDAENDPGSPLYVREHLFDVTLIFGDQRSTVSIYKNMHTISISQTIYGDKLFDGYYSAEGGTGIQLVDASGNIVVDLDTLERYKTLYAHFVNPFENIGFVLRMYEQVDGRYVLTMEQRISIGEDLSKYFYVPVDQNGLAFAGWQRGYLYDDTTANIQEMASSKTEFYEHYRLFNPLQLGYSYYTDETTLYLDLIAYYAPISYRVTYHYPAGFEHMDAALDYEYGAQLSSYTPNELSSYHFIGFALDEAGEQMLAADTLVTKDMEVYCIYREQITVIYEEANGEQRVITYGLGQSVTAEAPLYVADGMEFVGWSFRDTPDQTFTDFVVDERHRNAVLVAQFKPGTYTIRFTDKYDTVLRETTYRYGEEVALPPEEREYCVFLGWYDAERDILYTDGILPAGHFGDVTLVMQYTAEEFTISLQPIGGTIDQYEVKVAYGDNFTLPVPHRTGYTFKGWYYYNYENEKTYVTDGDGKSLIPFGRYEGIDYTIGLNIGLMAHWVPTTYQIVFKADGQVLSEVEVQHGELLLDFPSAPRLTGYTFDCWMFNGGKVDFGITIYENMTIEARYTPKVYSIRFFIGESDGSFSNGQREITATYTYGASELDMEHLGVRYDGYVLIGWYTDMDGNGDYCVNAEWGIMDAFKSYLAVDRAEYVLYAAWVKN